MFHSNKAIHNHKKTWLYHFPPEMKEKSKQWTEKKSVPLKAKTVIIFTNINCFNNVNRPEKKTNFVY